MVLCLYNIKIIAELILFSEHIAHFTNLKGNMKVQPNYKNVFTHTYKAHLNHDQLM